MHFSQRLRHLLRGDPATITVWIDESGFGWPATCVAITVLGCGVYGATLGLWHAPSQAAYTAIKFPLVVLLTAAGNGILNGVLAQLLGTGLSFRQTTRAILTSFALVGLILASFAPLTLFLLVNTPPLDATGPGHTVTLLAHVLLIAFAGVVANQRLFRLVASISGSCSASRRTLLAWLAGNLLLGSQFAWILRPFVGTPGLPIEFLRNDPMRGNFFESIAQTIAKLFP